MPHPSADLIPILYKRYAKSWQKLRLESEFVEQTWLDRFLKLVPENGTILDLGCGTGQPIAEYCIAQGFSIYGIDQVKPFIKRAQKQFPNQTWQLADICEVELSTQFDAIIAWDSLFHLPQAKQLALFTKLSQWAKPNAPLLFTSGHENGEAIGDFNGHPLYHASLSESEYRQTLIQQQFGLLQYQLQDPNCGYRSVWLAKRR